MPNATTYPHKISVTIGSKSISLEGDRNYIEEHLKNLMDKFVEASSSTPVSQSERIGGHDDTQSLSGVASTNTIASVLEVKSGSELVIAAAARLQMALGNPKFTRHEISEEMKEATTFYRSSFTSNLTKYLDSLVKSRKLNLVAKDTYSLSRPELTNLEQLLSELEA